MTRSCFRHVLALACAAALAACSGGTATPAGADDAGSSPWIAMARGQVDVEGGIVRVVAVGEGVIEEVSVGVGDAVARDAVLAVLDRRRTEIGVGIAEANLAQAEAQARAARARLPQARTQAARIAEAAAAGAASGQSAGEAKSALAVVEADIATSAAAVDQAAQHLKEAEAELDSRTIRAPVAGRIVQRSAWAGGTAQAGAELFQILPDRPRIVRAELDEAWVDRVTAGMRASVVRDSGDGEAVPAKVLRVGEVFGPSVLTDDPVERASAREVECVLELEGGDFRIGQRVLVRFER
ncbi:MAG: HlyD family efflux transporter periplasmic adaptor subunit [Xanthomonadales bacterium]|nr:HlyD family efflux transporter periplasmic adaptor subunit [Xanthomonadales bacterium]